MPLASIGLATAGQSVGTQNVGGFSTETHARSPVTPALILDEPSIFRGDFGELAMLMQRSWAENRNEPLLYSAEFLHSAFDYPGSTFELAPSVRVKSLASWRQLLLAHFELFLMIGFGLFFAHFSLQKFAPPRPR